MKSHKTTLAFVIGGISLLGTAVAVNAAQTPAASPPAAATPAPAKKAEPQREKPEVRKPGTITSGTIGTLKYTPDCGTFTTRLDPDAINSSTSKAFVQSQDAILDEENERWFSYRNCLRGNYFEDVDVVFKAVDTGFIAFNNDMNDRTKALVDSVSAAATRISSTPGKAKKAPKKGEAPPVAPAAPPAPAMAPTGRVFGTVAGGKADAITYTSGCPRFAFTVNVEDFAAATRENFDILRGGLGAQEAGLKSSRECLQTNYEQDRNAMAEMMAAGVNAILVPAETKWLRTYAETQRQINLQRQPGGVLAPADRARPAAAPKGKAKKK
jgi:hypothetical protein